MRFAAANITKGRLIAEALGWLTLGGVAAFLAETMRLYQQSQWERTHGADVAFVLISVLLPAVVASAAICTSAVKLHQFLTALFRRQIPPFDMPPIPRVDGPEPPGGAPVPARVPPKKPAPLAAHAVAVVEDDQGTQNSEKGEPNRQAHDILSICLWTSRNFQTFSNTSTAVPSASAAIA